MATYFITGTDTEVGKTFVSCLLLKMAHQRKLSTLALKPVASGCKKIDNKLYNDDALQLIKHMSVDLSYEQVNPFAFLPPIAPHIAAYEANQELNLKDITLKCQNVLSKQYDFGLIEGAGGWCVPLNSHQYLSDLAITLDIPVIVVVGIKLGCINHAILTINKIEQSGVRLAGWIANQIDPNMKYFKQNIQTLKAHIPQTNYLGNVAWLSTTHSNTTTQDLTLDQLFKPLK